MQNCQKCDQPDTKRMVTCNACKNKFHLLCVNTTHLEALKEWLCEGCTAQATPKKVAISARVKSNKTPSCSTRSTSTKGSYSSRRKKAEIELIEAEEALIAERQALLARKRDLLAETDTSDSEASDATTEGVRVEDWLSATSHHGEPSVAAELLEKVKQLEKQVSAIKSNKKTNAWLPDMNSAANNASDTPSSAHNKLSDSQVAARQGLSKTLPKFSGKPEDWPLFISTFQRTTELCGFSDIENMARLQAALEGPAKHAVRSLMLSTACVPQIISTLKMKFGRPELVINVLLTQIRAMPPPKENRLDTLVDFAVEVQNICATMKASNMDNFLNNPQLEQELVDKLPGLLKAFWGMHKLALGTSNLQSFSDWLFQFAQGANAVSVPSALPNPSKRGVVNTHNETFSANNKCIVCKGSCTSVQNCNVFNNANRPDRWKMVRNFKLCRKCLKPHYPKPCTSLQRCDINGCAQGHHRLLHNPAVNSGCAIDTNGGDANGGNATGDWNSHNDTSSAVLFRILPITLHGNGATVSTYAFFDEGSSITLMEDELRQHLNIAGSAQPLCLRWTANTKRYENESKVVDLKVSGANQAKRFPLRNIHTVNSLALPPQSLNLKDLQLKYKHLRGIPADSYTNVQPRVLIGLNNCSLGQVIKAKEGGPHEPIAEKTRLGWTIKGPLSISDNTGTHLSHFSLHICECEVSANKELLKLVRNHLSIDNAGLESPPKTSLSDDDIRANQLMESLTSRVGDRFQTGLLWKSNNVQLPNSLAMAKKRATCLNAKMQREPTLAMKLQNKIEDYVVKGYARRLQKEEIGDKKCWYLPVFPVTNASKPDKVRLVWDGAAKVNGVSLNDALLKGPDNLTSLLAVMRKFRQRKIAVAGDIAEMFHQVQIRPEDQHFQRFLWFEEGANEPSHYVMTVMTFGATCSPSCAQYVKNKNAAEFGELYPRAVQSILDNHYVDDMLDSVDTEEEAIQLAQEVALVHAKGGFTIRNWCSNSSTVLKAMNAETSHELDFNEDLNTEKVLGMWWSTADDCFTYKISQHYRTNKLLKGQRPTKRELLSLVMSIFDPLGLLGFYVMHAKVLLQDTWRSGCAWDELIDDEQFSKWQYWLQFLPYIELLKIPRCYINTVFRTYPELELHTFVDASEAGYAAVSYFRCADGKFVDCTIIGSKTKVAPLKATSIPRLELQAALLGARLARDLVTTHSIEIKRTVFWSDSRTVLSWLRSDHRRYRQFVAFRVSEILELTDISDWRWIPSADNVADDATKWQKKPDFSANSRWYKGPTFLKLQPDCWPQEFRSSVTTEEIRTKFVAHHIATNNTILINPADYSTWQRLLLVVSCTFKAANKWLHFAKKVSNCKTQQEVIRSAEVLLFKIAQQSEYAPELRRLAQGKPLDKSNAIFKLTPYIDNQGLLRLGGRAVLDGAENLIILPRSHPVTYLLVSDFHIMYRHANHEVVVNEVRQRFWIPHLRAVVREVRSNCQLCKNAHVQPQPPKMAPLPPARLAVFHRPFSYTGVDYFGPINVSVLRSKEKRYGVLFTCLTTRAVHLEIAHSLTTDSCIIAVRNFVARRGMPTEIWSDNGTNFVGAQRELSAAFEHVDKNQIVKTFTTAASIWRFIPPASPHMGGVWERLVRSVKGVLRNILPSFKFNDEILRASLMEVEMILNSRPLTYVSVDADGEALTPNHFLLGRSSFVKPLFDSSDRAIDLWRSYRTSQRMADLFWKRWIREYLPVITRRSKWFTDVKPIEIGDIVFVVDPNSPRNCWPKGRVLEVYQGGDGQVRSALIQTSAGIYRRPATRLAVLDVDKSKVGPEGHTGEECCDEHFASAT